MDQEKNLYREIYQHFQETQLITATGAKGDYMLIQLWEWANHAVIDVFTKLVGITDGTDLEEVYKQAKDYAINLCPDDLVDIDSQKQKDGDKGVFYLLAALAYRSMAAEEVLQKETTFGQATFTMQNNKGKTATQEDLNRHVTQLANVEAGVLRYRNAPKETYQHQILLNVRRSLMRPQSDILLDVQNNLSVEFWQRFNKVKKAIINQDWNNIALPVTGLESPHPQWDSFIFEKARESIKKYVTENYDLCKDWPEIRRCCINAFDGMAGKMENLQAKHERKIEQNNVFEKESAAISLQDKTSKTDEREDFIYEEIDTVEKNIKWKAIAKAVSSLYKGKKSRLVIELLKMKAHPNKYTEKDLTIPIAGHPDWPGMPISTQKYYLKQISELIQKE